MSKRRLEPMLALVTLGPQIPAAWLGLLAGITRSRWLGRVAGGTAVVGAAASTVLIINPDRDVSKAVIDGVGQVGFVGMWAGAAGAPTLAATTAALALPLGWRWRTAIIAGSLAANVASIAMVVLGPEDTDHL